MNDKQDVAYPYSGILLAIKKNKLLIYATTRINHERIILNERSQLQRNIYCMIPLKRNVQNTNT